MMPGYHRLSAFAPRRGFTLLEILLAVTMYGLMIGGLVSTVYAALRLRERALNMVEESSAAEMALQTLRADLRAMVPPNEPLQRHVYGISLDVSTGRSDELEFGCFSGHLHPESVWGDLQFVRYKLIEPSELGVAGTRRVSSTSGSADTADEGLVLVRYVMRNLLSPYDLEEDPQPLLRNVLSLEFSYYSEGEWIDSWDSENMEDAIPEAVEARITYEIPDKQGAQRDRTYTDALFRQVTRVLCVPITVKPIVAPEEVEETEGEGM